MSNCTDLRDWCLEAIASPGCQTVTADLSGLTFLDSSGIRALIEAQKAAASRAVIFAIANPRRSCARS